MLARLTNFGWLSLSCFLLSIICLLIGLTACTYSVNCVHTQGEASDVVDEDQAASPDVKTDLSIPLKPL